MNCILEKKINEHGKVRDVRYTKNFVNCPLFAGRQICYWCCLHIHDIAEPIRRGDYSVEHPEYESTIPKETSRDWDDIWSTCSKCAR